MTRQYAINALVKLSTRLSDEQIKNKDDIRDILLRYGSSLDVELQQRALEYSVIFTKYDHHRTALLEKMPPFEKELDENSATTENVADTGPDLVSFDAGNENPAQNATETNQSLLEGILMDSTPSAPAASAPSSGLADLLGMDAGSSTAATEPAQKNSADLLAGLSLGDTEQPPPVTTQSTNTAGILDFGDSTPSVPASNTCVETIDDISINFAHSNEPNSQVARVEATISNTSDTVFENFNFQVAVNKEQQLQLLQPTGTTLAKDNRSIGQTFRINNPSQLPLRMKIRMTYTVDGENVEKIAVAKNIPEEWR